MSFADAFNKPILHTLDGKEYRLEFLTMDDLAEISREIVHDAKQAALRAVPLTKKVEREEVTAYFDGLDIDMNELARQCMTLKGCGRFIRKALIRGKHSPADADAFINGMIATEGMLSLGNVACRISRLFKPLPVPNVATPPAGESPGGENEVSQSTGEPSESTPAEPSAAQTPAD